MSEIPNEPTAVQKAHLKPSFYATKPTRGTIFLRTFLPWQAWRVYGSTSFLLPLLLSAWHLSSL